MTHNVNVVRKLDEHADAVSAALKASSDTACVACLLACEVRVIPPHPHMRFPFHRELAQGQESHRKQHSGGQ